MVNSYAKEKIVKAIKIIIYALSVLIGLFHLYTATFPSVTSAQVRVTHFAAITLIGFLYLLVRSFSDGKKINTFFLFILSLVVLFLCIYFYINFSPAAVQQRGITGASEFELIVGIIAILIALFITQQYVGWPLTIVGIVFILYTLLGPYLPEFLAHRGYSLRYATEYLVWTLEGLFGIPIRVTSSYVIIFVIFGSFLSVFGAGDFLVNLSYAFTGRVQGGPALTAVFASGLLGSINGSAVANVVTTGNFTIPLMKKIGYKPAYAAAVEAVASTGGQIMPPVMGAAAFVMADMIGLPYSTIIIAALLPAVFYYLALILQVRIQASKMNVAILDRSELPALKKVLKEGYYYFIPIIVLLVALMIFRLSPTLSGIYAIVTMVIIGVIKTLIVEKRFPIKEILDALNDSIKAATSIVAASGTAGIVIGVVSMTGIGVRLAQTIYNLSGGILIFALPLLAIACLILGMGLPTTAAYVIVAVVGGRALVQFGVPELAAHLFIFYFAVISFITPPVAISAYAAAGIAKSNAMETGWRSVLLGIGGFIVPFLLIYHPALIIVGYRLTDIILAILIAVLGIFALCIAIEGWLLKKLNLLERLVFFLIAVLTLIPEIYTSIVGVLLLFIMFIKTGVFSALAATVNRRVS